MKIEQTKCDITSEMVAHIGWDEYYKLLCSLSSCGVTPSIRELEKQRQILAEADRARLLKSCASAQSFLCGIKTTVSQACRRFRLRLQSMYQDDRSCEVCTNPPNDQS